MRSFALYRACPLSIVLAVVVPLSRASTFVVDDDGGPGVQFTDIPPAITAALPGDVLLVRPGSYSAFVLDKGLTLVADAGADVAGSVTVQGVATVRAILTGITSDYLVVSGCSRVVILAGMTVRGAPNNSFAPAVDVTGCSDVRFQGLMLPGGSSNFHGADAVRVASSRVEIVRSSLRARDGQDTLNQPTPRNGGDGIRVGDGGNVHLSLSTVRGGDGGDNPYTFLFPTHGGNGGHGVRLAGAGARLFLAGVAADLVSGGDNGIGNDCPDDGLPGHGVLIASGTTARISGATVQGGSYSCSGPTNGVQNSGGSVTLPAPADPSMEALPPVLGPGQVGTFVVYGDPGSELRLRLGRRPIVEDLPTTNEDRLVEQLRSYTLGPCPPSGSVAFPFTMPSTSPVGALLVFQALSIDPTGVSELTASWPAVFR